MFQIDAIIFDSDELVDHRLVSPLVEQRSNRIFLAVADQQVSGWRISRHPVHKFTLLSQFLLGFLGDVSAKRAVSFIADNRIRSSGHKHSKESIDDTVGCHLVLHRPLVLRM